ncbi:MAG: competence protein CoiA family protein [Mobilitalea sp.]
MYIAIDQDNNRVYIDDAILGRDYFCPACTERLSMRCGEKRHHYFAHFPGSICMDSWDGQYDMSDWHRDWQNLFPTKNQEVLVQLGEIKHRADVLIGKTIIEFQHSPMSTETFNKRNAFYHDLGYKVVWVFDLVEECEESKITQDTDAEGIVLEWKRPRNTFNWYDIKNGQIELFLQLHEEGEKCLIKVYDTAAEGFSRFTASGWYSKEDFLEYFQCSDGKCPEPVHNDITVNEEYIAFKKKYDVCLNPQQERAVQTVEGATLVLAVPGSGKTTVLITRIGYMINCKHINAKSILALTYTKNAACDMKDRYTKKFGKNDGVQFRTINSLADETVRRFGDHKPMIPNTEKNKIIKDIYKEYYQYEWPTERDVKSAETSIAFIKNMMLKDDEIKSLIIWNQNALPIYSKYCICLYERGFMDFDDQLVYAHKILNEKGEVLSQIQEQYKFICVDEAQDTSKIQYEIIKLLAKKNHSIFMVGDEDQSIYRFRAAYPQALLNFKNEYSNPFILQLETNYRSTIEIVDLATSFISKNKKRFPKEMHAVNGHGEKVQQILASTREEQYNKLLDMAKINKVQMAFLYRDNACVIPIIDIFLKNDISFKIRKPEEIYFFDEHVVKDIKAFLNLALNDRDINSFKQIYYKCGVYINAKDVNGACNKVKYEGKNIYEALSAWLTYGYRNDGDKAEAFMYKVQSVVDMQPSDAITHIYNNGYSKYLSEKGMSSGYVELLVALARNDESIHAFLEHLYALERQIKNLEDKEANIVLSTVHSSKGLEYDTVYIIDVYNGMFPGSCDKGTEEDCVENEEEERRLFYVAMTRAKKSLNMFLIHNKPSSYIDELFPCHGSTLYSIIEIARGTDVIIENMHLQEVYKLTFLYPTRFNAFKLDVETGEIESLSSNKEVWDMANANVWRIYTNK